MSTGHTTTGYHPQLNKRSDQIHLHAPTTRYLCPFRPKHSRLNATHQQGPSISFAITDVRYRPLLSWNVVKSVLCTCSYLPIRTKREEIPQDISITIASSDRDAFYDQGDSGSHVRRVTMHVGQAANGDTKCVSNFLSKSASWS